jgi:hypothetical protein
MKYGQSMDRVWIKYGCGTLNKSKNYFFLTSSAWIEYGSGNSIITIKLTYSNPAIILNQWEMSNQYLSLQIITPNGL